MDKHLVFSFDFQGYSHCVFFSCFNPFGVLNFDVCTLDLNGFVS